MNEQNEFIKNYLHTEYVGCLKTDHEKCIDLQYEEIGNFVQNAGMFGDLEISIKHNGLVLFDTNGIYINKVFPNTEYSRDYLMELINSVAMQLQSDFDDGDIGHPTGKVNEFIKENFQVDLLNIEQENKINFSLLRLNRKMIREIIYIFSFKNIFVLTIFVLIFVVIDKIQYKIKIKYDFKYNFVQWELLTKKFIELYFFVLSLYLSNFVLLNQKLNEYNTYEMICFLFFIVSVWIYCMNVLSKIFKEDSYFDYEYNKSKYLNNTLLKFEGKNIDDINKKIALLELYEKTSNAYDKGIRIDKEEFKRKEIEKSYLKVNKD